MRAARELETVDAGLQDLADVWLVEEKKRTARRPPPPRPIDFVWLDEVVTQYVQGRVTVTRQGAPRTVYRAAGVADT